MKIIYLYILDTMAEWEIGHILQAMSMESRLKQNPEFEIRTVGTSKDPINSIGGLTISAEYTLDEVDEDNMVALLLPGAYTWGDEVNKPILKKALSYIERGIVVATICGSTLALANLSVLDRYRHTSNTRDYLARLSKVYGGHDLYVDSPAVADKNVITASMAGGLQWAKCILQQLGVYPETAIEAWYNYYHTGDPKYYAELLTYRYLDS